VRTAIPSFLISSYVDGQSSRQEQIFHAPLSGMTMVERDLSRQFTELVADLFRTNAMDVEIEPQEPGQPDLIIRSSSGISAVVEVKLYRSWAAPIGPVQQAAAIIEIVRQNLSATKAILVVGNRLTEAAQAILKERNPALITYNLNTLTFLAADHPVLRTRLAEIVRQALAFSEPSEILSGMSAVDINADLAQRSDDLPPPSPPPTPEQPRKGRNLCQELRSIERGRANAKRFEEKMTEAVQYIFDDDLTAWQRQKATDTNVSFYDLVARVASGHDFWSTIVAHFSSRYIIFEFKNYGTKIKQGQIYTTEKYLFRPALRSTAFIISKKGADENALAAARGALREHGKLIVNLTVDDVCDMLGRKDKGDDPNALLVDKVDEMLMKLER
jgi:restriction endonuclease